MKKFTRIIFGIIICVLVMLVMTIMEGATGSVSGGSLILAILFFGIFWGSYNYFIKSKRDK